MGNTPSNTSSSSSGRGRKSRQPETAAERAKKVVGDIQEEFKRSVKKLDDDHPAAQLIDTVCGGYFDDDKYRQSRSASFYSEGEFSEDGSRTVGDDDTYDDSRRGRARDASTVESSSYVSQSDFESEPKNRRRRGANSNSFDTEDDSRHVTEDAPPLLSKPLASSFAKRCYFTKSGIGKTTQHYEGLTLTGNVVLMLAAAMKLKGCPTICDEDLRRVEQTYPNQFSRLPDELLLSSGWRRISKYCHFSGKPIPDGVPFFHSKQRLHPSGGYYFLLASAVGMIRPSDAEPLNRDTLVLLETDFPTQCDQAPDILINDPEQWTLVNKFCFFSGGPINVEEDVYYQADFDGNPIFMLAFLSPSLTPEELYKLSHPDEPGLTSCKAVEEVESVYDLTERDFEDLKLYHLGPCRALPQYILQPSAWLKILPNQFIAAKETAMRRAREYEMKHGSSSEDVHEQEQHQAQEQPLQYQQQHPPLSSPGAPQQSQPQGHAQLQLQLQQQSPDVLMPAPSAPSPHVTPSLASPALASHYQHHDPHAMSPHMPAPQSTTAPHTSPNRTLSEPPAYQQPGPYYGEDHHAHQSHAFAAHATDPARAGPQADDNAPAGHDVNEYQRAVEEEGAFVDNSAPMDEAIAARFPTSPHIGAPDPETPKLDPPEDEPPSLMKRDNGYEDQAMSPDNSTTQNGDRAFFGAHAPDYYPSPDKHFGPPQNGGRDYATSPEQETYYSPDHQSFDNTGQHENHYTDQHQHTQQDGLFNHEQYQQHGADASTFHSHQEDFPTPSFGDNNNYYQHHHHHDEEKKTSVVDDPGDPDVEYSGSLEYDENGRPLAEGEADFTPIKRNGYTLRRGPNNGNNITSPSPKSQSGVSVGSQSAALRGAQELLKKNRRRRLEMASKARRLAEQQHQQSPKASPSRKNGANTDATPRDDESAATWESGSEFTASVISGSSVWTDGSNGGEKSSRRALILQMAKARMKSNREMGPRSPSSRADDQVATSPIDEEQQQQQQHYEVPTAGATEEVPSPLGNDGNPDIDIVGDLD